MQASTRRSAVIEQILEEVYAKFRRLKTGQPANYIPELAKADPEDFGIVISTADGRVYEVGDTRKRFTIQSISKPFAYGLALKLCTVDRVLKKVGVEPSGDAFNAISLHPETGIPKNPMINAGAIATTAMIWANDPENAESVLLDFLSDMAGNQLTVDENVFLSEKETGHRNRAIGYLLRNSDVITASPEEALDLYFRQCAVSLTCHDLALMAATLACQGQNPHTGVKSLDAISNTSVLAVMGSCGMYDFTGQWLYNIGMPSKSGVGGGVMAVVPGRLGIAVYSPPLDTYGNSTRGIAVYEELSRRLNLHLFDQPNRTATVIRSSTNGTKRYSRRWRSKAEFELLQKHGEQIKVIQAQGVLDFAAIEELLAHLEFIGKKEDLMVVDLAQVLDMPEVSAHIMHEGIKHLREKGVSCIPCRGSHLKNFWPHEGSNSKGWLNSLDGALEMVENLILKKVENGEDDNEKHITLLADLKEETRMELIPLLKRRTYKTNELLCKKGEAGCEIFFLEKGVVSAGMIDAETNKWIRFATFGSGVCIGEIAFLNDLPRTADVMAEHESRCLILDRSTFNQLEENKPKIAIDILLALHRDLARKVDRANQQLGLLEQR